jgi:hypothetical protein
MSLADKLRNDGENLAADLAQELGDRRLPSKLARELNYDGRVDHLTMRQRKTNGRWRMAARCDLNSA